MEAEKREKKIAYFLKNYRIIWLVLFIGALLWTPFATLGFFGFLTWLTPASALFTWLATFVLALTLFVAGRWEPGFVNGRAPRESDDVSY